MPKRKHFILREVLSKVNDQNQNISLDHHSDTVAKCQFFTRSTTFKKNKFYPKKIPPPTGGIHFKVTKTKTLVLVMTFMIFTLLLKCILTRSTLTWEALNRPKNVRIIFNSNVRHVLPSDCLTLGNVCDPILEEQLGIYRYKLRTGIYRC